MTIKAPMINANTSNKTINVAAFIFKFPIFLCLGWCGLMGTAYNCCNQL